MITIQLELITFYAADFKVINKYGIELLKIEGNCNQYIDVTLKGNEESLMNLMEDWGYEDTKIEDVQID